MIFRQFNCIQFLRSSFIFTSWLFLTGLSLQAQNVADFAKTTDIFPAPPNASAIIKNNLTSINKNTGAPNINIDLMGIKGSQLAVGMSLSYSSTGIKVDEIASRVGMGWSLNAGGVVTRTVRGTPDESAPRLTPPGTFAENCETFNYLKKVSDANDGLVFADAEPDIFHFSMNGLSGSFVFNASMQPVLIKSEKFKVQYDFLSTAIWNFKITTSDGLIYYFGGAGATEKSKRESSCGRTYDAYLSSSWYLKKIEHPNGEVMVFDYTPINYSYETGFSETMEWIFPIPIIDAIPAGSVNIACPDCPLAASPRRCVNRINTQGVLLSRITSNAGNLVDIVYMTRTDCDDKLVSELQYTTSEGPLGKYTFSYDIQTANMTLANEVASGYDKTPYLSSVSKFSSAMVLSGQHKLYYNDPSARPPRLSCSQDHWGYFNGIRNATTFIPLPTDALLIQQFPFAVANREAYEGFAAKGMLAKIVYPGGAMDSIIYESNSITTAAESPVHVLNTQVTGTSVMTTASTSTTFSITYKQNIELQKICTAGNGTVDPLHNTGYVTLSSSAGVIVSEQLIAGSSVSTVYDLQPGLYTLTINANGAVITTRASIKY
ncbi:MAG: hypothetical protein ABIN67_10870, partial [Ferruginibacter sp.]